MAVEDGIAFAKHSEHICPLVLFMEGDAASASQQKFRRPHRYDLMFSNYDIASNAVYV